MMEATISNRTGAIWHYDQNSFNFSRARTKNGTTYTTHYDVGESLGNGANGVVHVLTPTESQKGRKLKAFKYSTDSMKREYEISLNWPNKSTGLLLRPKAYLLGFGNGALGNMIVMHKYDGSLADFYLAMNRAERLEAVCQISQGLVTLHDLHILHGDLRLANIFCDENMNRYDLGDFGSARFDDDGCCADDKYDVFRLIEAITLIFFGKNCVTRAQAPQEKWLEVLQGQGYSFDLAEQIVNFLAAPPTNAKAVSAFFNDIQYRTQSS